MNLMEAFHWKATSLERYKTGWCQHDRKKKKNTSILHVSYNQPNLIERKF